MKALVCTVCRFQFAAVIQVISGVFRFKFGERFFLSTIKVIFKKKVMYPVRYIGTK
jgi:hypothetical protein